MSSVLDRNLALGILTAVVILAIAPALFPPRKTPFGLPETVTQLISQYIYGTGALLVGYITWLLLIERQLLPLEVITGLIAITTAGGATVVGRYVSITVRRWIAAAWINHAKAAKLENERND